MADPLTRLGISRRPAYELFGTPDTSKFGWSDATRQAVADDQAMADEEAAMEDERAALEDRRIAREREREAEGLADQFARIKEPSAREKFFDENEATMTGSKRYNQLAEMRQRQPSYADNVLAKNLANKIDDPDERNVFLGAVAKGAGTLAAREEADRFRMKRVQATRLGEVGYTRAERDEILTNNPDEAEIEYLVAQRKKETSRETDADPAIAALIGHQKALSELSGSLITDPVKKAEVDAKLAKVTAKLADKFESIYNRTPPAAEEPNPAPFTPRSQRTPEAAPAPADPMAALRRKLGLVKP